MAEVNQRQAFVIEGAEILPNDRGTAPGQWIDDSGAVAHALARPAARAESHVRRANACRAWTASFPRQVIRTLVLRVAGMAESDLDQTISPVYKKYENPVTTILAGEGDIQIHLRARCTNEAEAIALLAEVAGPIDLLLGDRIYSRNGDPLEVIVGELLKKHHATLSVAESMTAGWLGTAHHVGSRQFQLLPGRLHRLQQKDEESSCWACSEEILEQHGAVSQETAEAMAIGARRRTGSTFALAITGEAGPDPSENVPVGTVYVGLADASGTQVLHRQFFGDRTRIRVFATQMALDMLRKKCTIVS